MEHKEFVLAYVNDEWLTWQEATILALRRDEEAKERFLGDVFPVDYGNDNDDLYAPACYGL